MSKNFNQAILPPATIGIVGGGQLGQMLALSAKAMGYQVAVLDPDKHCSAGQVADCQITAQYTDVTALKMLANVSDVLTYEFENVDAKALDSVASLTALPQGTALLTITGNRLNEKTFLREHGILTTAFRRVTTAEELSRALRVIGFPSILKTAAGGYDGHGQVDLNAQGDEAAALALLQQGACILEKKQHFVKELSIMVTRSAAGKVTTFPLVENRHYQHILHETIAPAAVAEVIHQEAARIARVIASALHLRGVLGIEFFLLPDGQLLVNELAPRPHNSGHYTIEACNISQFEAHIRSICGLALPPVTLNQAAVMVNLLGQHLDPARRRLPERPSWHFHDYSKSEIRKNRKMGHLTILGDPEQTLSALCAEKIWEAD